MYYNQRMHTRLEIDLFKALCVRNLRGEFSSATNLQRAIAFWPFFVGAIVVYAINNFDAFGFTCALSVLIPFFIIAALGWGNETKKWAAMIIRQLIVSEMNPVKLPDQDVKIPSRAIPVPHSPPRFCLA